jgi:hypothetical protein
VYVSVLFWFNRLYALQTQAAERVQVMKRGSDVSRVGRKTVKRKSTAL